MRFPESLCRKQLEALHQAAIPAELRFFREQAKKMLAPILGALHQETNERFELRDFDGKAARQRAANKTKYEDRIHPENFLKNSVYFSVERVAMRPRFLFWGKPVETRKTVAHVNVRIADHSWEAALFDRKMNAMTTARGAACKFLNTPNLSAIDKALPPPPAPEHCRRFAKKTRRKQSVGINLIGSSRTQCPHVFIR